MQKHLTSITYYSSSSSMTRFNTKRLRNRSSRIPWRKHITSPLRVAVYSIIIIGLISLHTFLRNGASPSDASFVMSTFRDQLFQRQKIHKSIRNFRELPNHCTRAEFKEIIIKGERHCGTHLVQSILENNVNESILVKQDSLDIGWKHGYLPPEGWGRPIEQNDLLIVVTRDVFTWLPKMHKETYDTTFNKKIHHSEFKAFIEEPYTASCQPQHHVGMPTESEYQDKFCRKLAGGRTWFGVNEDKIIAERATNVVQIRTEKYKQWLSEDPGEEAYNGTKEDYLAKRVHIRLEDLIDVKYGKDVKERQEAVVGDKLQNQCVPIYDEFTETNEALKWIHELDPLANPFNAEKEKHNMLKHYSKEELRFVLSQLDMEFEKKIGYNYDYVYELLESTAFPESQKHHRRREHHRYGEKTYRRVGKRRFREIQS